MCVCVWGGGGGGCEFEQIKGANANTLFINKALDRASGKVYILTGSQLFCIELDNYIVWYAFLENVG